MCIFQELILLEVKLSRSNGSTCNVVIKGSYTLSYDGLYMFALDKGNGNVVYVVIFRVTFPQIFVQVRSRY